ncbi:MAG TPA: mammalian cell entry protein [Hydrogenophaga sp.]|uniref:MlaD family protein n=1 Tax=Hydrogenophaga sp. TaxID=1904254 RepID=UPI002CDD0200|nr:mammalian cell entry protein [Hydrogenophaga sp.]HMN93936.1 mammalian cell entry protein [Hydrogenophaga sp.]HMP10751.1 mammalian cell entry protein [Hydrogenophaga sp.]
MNPDNRPPPPATTDVPPVPYLEFKAALLLLAMVVLLASSVVYVMYARGLFESTQRLVLVSDDSEGVVVGMNMTFAGFAIGRVARIELGDDGNARILIDVPTRDAKWLRTSSVFTMERGLVGGTRIRAYSGVLEDPPLEDGAERQVLRGDASAEIPRLTAQVRDLLDNLNALTAPGGALAGSLAHVQDVTGALKGPHGALGVLMGNEADARKLVATIEGANALLSRSDALVQRLDALVANADRQVFGAPGRPGETVADPGLVGEVRALVGRLDGVLADTRGTLQKVDAVLVEAQGIASNTREATTDLGTLRAEVESSLRQIESLVNDINRRWPFSRDTEIRLP